MPSLLSALRSAARSLGRARTTTGILLVSLGLGIGANASLYSAIDALLFRAPAGVREPSRLVTIHTSQYNGAVRGPSSYPDYVSARAGIAAFESLAAFDDSRSDVVDAGRSMHRVRIVAATSGLFETLGLTPHAGRFPETAESEARSTSAVISHSFWTTIGQPGDAVGSQIRVGNQRFTIAAIAPERFDGLQLGRRWDVWVPLQASAHESRGDRRLSIVARLKPDADIESAQAALSALAGTLAEQYPETNRGTRSDDEQPRGMRVERYSRLDSSQRTQMVLIGVAVLGATGLLLMSACVNAATMLLSRSAARRRELAIKVALGASRALLIRQVLMETLLITLGGAALGLLFASWTAGTLPAFFAPEEASMLDIRLDARIVVATVLFSCLAGVLFAVGPSRHAASTPDADVLRSDNATVGEAPSGARLRRAVVIGQVALSTLMLIASGLLVRVLASALDGGFGPGGRGVAIAMVKMPGADAGDALRGLLFYRRALESARTIPGAEAVAWTMTLPVGRATVQRFQMPAGAGLTESADLEVNVASPGYFRTLRIAVIDGRPFTPDDGALTKPVVIVNDVLARRHFRTRAVGGTLVDREGTAYEIVGVVRTGRYRTFQEAPEPMVYFPLAQSDPTYMHLVVRTAGDPRPTLPVLARILRASDEGADVRWTMTFDDHLREALSLDRLTTIVVVACALAALALATIGVYGVMSDVVRRRTSEIGLRVALGASTLQVITLVFGEGLHLTMAGAIAGVLSAVLLGRIGRSLVDGLPHLDPVSLALVPIVLTLVVAGAAVLPALRALRISPTIALRAE